jgi:ATP-dependent DNA helicase RecQ
MTQGTPHVTDAPPTRSHVALSLYGGRGEVRQRAFVDVMRRVPRPAIVFCNTPRDVESVFGALRAAGMPVHRYHEELRPGVRAGEQLSFAMPGERAILVATSAFAPGSDPCADDPESVPARYGRRTTKNDIRSLVRFQPPASLDQLVDELGLVARDGQSAEAVVFYDASDGPRLETDLEAARPSGEHLQCFGKALEASFDREARVTTEALALSSRGARRAIESVAALLHDMGLVSLRDGWLRPLATDSVIARELRALAEKLVTVRALDARRLAEFAELGTHAGCGTAKLRRLLGDAEPPSCGACVACRGLERQAPVAAPVERHTPARRFTVSTEPVSGPSATTFHTDGRGSSPLTAKIADFRS